MIIGLQSSLKYPKMDKAWYKIRIRVKYKAPSLLF